MYTKDKNENLKINLETEFSKAKGGQYTLVKNKRISVEGRLRRTDKVLEAFTGQRFESWSWCLSFEGLQEEFFVGFPLQEGEVFSLARGA